MKYISSSIPVKSHIPDSRKKKELVQIGLELCTLTKSDIHFILDDSTSLAAAENRMITCRKKASLLGI